MYIMSSQSQSHITWDFLESMNDLLLIYCLLLPLCGMCNGAIVVGGSQFSHKLLLLLGLPVANSTTDVQTDNERYLLRSR